MFRKTNLLILIIGIVIITLLFLLFRLYVSPNSFFQRNTISIVAQGQNAGTYVMPLQGWLHDFFHFNQVRNICRDTQKENQRLLIQNIKITQLQEENDQLRQILKLKKEKSWHLVLARVILTDPTGLSGSFLIDKGEEDGLKEGMNVIIGEKILVGNLVKCFSTYCQGVSILHPDSRLSVRDNRSKIIAIAERDSGGKLLLKLVSQEADIQKGDILVTSQENPAFLPDLLVARVGDQQGIAANFLKDFSLEPFFERNDILSVLVITDFKGR